MENNGVQEEEKMEKADGPKDILKTIAAELASLKKGQKELNKKCDQWEGK